MYVRQIHSQNFIRPLLYSFCGSWSSSFAFSLGDTRPQCIACMLIISVIHCLFKYQTVYTHTFQVRCLWRVLCGCSWFCFSDFHKIPRDDACYPAWFGCQSLGKATFELFIFKCQPHETCPMVEDVTLTFTVLSTYLTMFMFRCLIEENIKNIK